MKTDTLHVSDLTPFEQAQVNAQLFASKLLITSTLVDVLERADAELLHGFDDLPEDVRRAATVDAQEAAAQLTSAAAVMAEFGFVA